MLDTLSILIHADSKVGKSTLAGSAPPPLVIFDAEGSTKFLPLRKVLWDPLRAEPPTWDGTWDAAIVNVHSYDVLDQGYRWLMTGRHNFRSLVLDSISEMQRKLKTKLVGVNRMARDNWDDLLRNMDGLLRGFRDLNQHPHNPIQVAAFVAETRLVDGKYKPYLQGQIATAAPYWFDLVGYMWVEPLRGADGAQQTDPSTGKPAKIRRLLVAAGNPMYEAGERVQGRLPDVVDNPNLTQMLYAIYPHLSNGQLNRLSEAPRSETDRSQNGSAPSPPDNTTLMTTPTEGTA